jgi:hypothetical protein
LKIIFEYYQYCSEELGACFRSGNRLIREKQVPEQHYHNEYNGRPLTDNQADIKAFLDYEIMVLFNGLVGFRKEDDCWDETIFDRFNLHPEDPSSDYLLEFILFFETTIISVPFLFLTLCWIRSVQCLENSDQLFLYKTVYLYRSFVRQRHTNFTVNLRTYYNLCPFYDDTRLDLFHEFRSHREYYDDPERCLNSRRLLSWNIYCHHPFLVGIHFLEEVFHDHDRCDCLLSDGFSFSQTLPLIYRSFRALGMLSKTIPFLEEFFEFMDQSYRLRHSPVNRMDPTFVDPSRKEAYFTVWYLSNYSKCPNDGKPHDELFQLIPESIEFLASQRHIGFIFHSL